MSQNLFTWIDLPTHNDSRGRLVAIESAKSIPFEIRRVYYMRDLEPGVSRGFHAHWALQQLVVCVAGSCKMILDDGFTRSSALLDSADRGLLIGSMLWHEMHDFSVDCVLLVLASDHYSESDYMRNYQEFSRAVVQ